jgi:hypothetical protein
MKQTLRARVGLLCQQPLGLRQLAFEGRLVLHLPFVQIGMMGLKQMVQ